MDTTVLLISDTVYDANGVSRFIQDMAAQSRQRDGRFSVLSASPLGGEEVESNIVNLRPFWYVRMPFYREQFLTIVPPWMQMYRYVKAASPDVIHISTPGPLGICAMLIAKRCGIPVAGTYHTDFPSYIRKQIKLEMAEAVTRRFMRFFFHRMQRVFSRSQHYMEVLERELKMEERKLRFLPPGSNTERFSPRHRDPAVWPRFDIPVDTLKILYVGRLSVEKNFLFVVDLFETLQRTCDVPLSLIVVGEGSLAESVSRRRNSHIHLLGLQGGSDLSALYASSDLMLFASVTETLGQVVMEAQASGLPCIVSDQGGVTDTVAHGKTGYCLSVEDDDEWQSNAKTMIESSVLRQQMGMAGWQRMQERSIAQTYERFMQAHDEIVKH
ncbi:glycosyltransferase family 1 protein [Sulfurimonas sp. HSL-3221]|uniref:glycosyltransferase family 4 protein n=1 Tax=Thiomicrolovo sulfuroxydans TaxID=2894755 RepID=UPI001E4A71A2|nr:glycosyltransferase family 1 protein [Sulfurimonas sp. HSL-3221]UFS63155.1 glycosyltransferase family 1 protein [Sulfurimonas sp. HSL-3221]